MKRLFVAISIPPDISEHVQSALHEAPDIYGMRTVPKENWHITVIFLGSHDKQNERKITSICADHAKKTEAPTISLDAIRYGPPGRFPRMLWATGHSPALGKTIAPDLSRALENNNIPHSIPRDPFHPHITLGRIKKRTPVEKLPAIAATLNATFTAPSLDIFSSQLTPTGALYTLRSTHPFKA